jgi:hypothetical protein
MAEIRGGLALLRETAIGIVNSTNTVFTTSRRYISGTLKVELNGQVLVRDDDYTETTNQSFTMTMPPIDNLNYTDIVMVEYQQQ